MALPLVAAGAATTTAVSHFTRFGFFGHPRATMVLMLGQSLNGCASKVVIRHFCKSKALAAVRIVILDHLGAATEANGAKSSSRFASVVS